MHRRVLEPGRRGRRRRRLISLRRRRMRPVRRPAANSAYAALALQPAIWLRSPSSANGLPDRALRRPAKMGGGMTRSAAAIHPETTGAWDRRARTGGYGWDSWDCASL